MLDKINIDEIQASSRMYPAIIFEQERNAGDQILEVDGLSAHDEKGNILFQNISFKLNRGDKVALLSDDHRMLTALYEILTGNKQPSAGIFAYGQTIRKAYLPNENSEFFDTNDNLMDWLRDF